MKTWLPAVCLVCLGITIPVTAPAGTTKTIYTSDWRNSSLATQPGCQVIVTTGEPILKIVNTNGRTLDVSLLLITNPATIRKADSISVEMKYEDVKAVLVPDTNRIRFDPGLNFERSASGSLDLLRRMPPPAPGGDESTNESKYAIPGSANWRPFEFGAAAGFNEGLPLQLELKLSLPGSGTVYVRPAKVRHFTTAWWSPENVGLIGGIGGSVLGCLGGLMGCLVGSGRARCFVLSMTRGLIGLGIMLTLTGLGAVATGQAYAVWYPCLLIGGILTLVFGVNLYPIKRRYEDLEITSTDALR
jgi:hypothetical protein